MKLKDKPKIFFIQACRGPRPSKPVDEPDDEEPPQQPSISRKLDFYFSYATDPGHVALRNGYLQFLSKALEEHSAECSLDEIVMHVHQQVADKIKMPKINNVRQKYQQIPQVVHQMRGPVYFK